MTSALRITVRVNFFGSMCDAVGIPSVSVSLADTATVADLLNELRRLFTTPLEGFEKGKAYYAILVDGRNVAFLDGMKTRLGHVSTVSFLPMFGGG